MNFLLVFIGGGLGSILRYSIGLALQKSSLSLPLATLIANVTACVLFAWCLRYSLQSQSNESILRPLLLTGFCGGLSTFSTFGYETFLLIKQQQSAWAILNIILSVALCVGAFYFIKK